MRYLLRDDTKYCRPGMDCTRFMEALRALISDITCLPVDVQAVDDQIARLSKRLAVGSRILSLDRWYRGDHQWNVSRVFEFDSDHDAAVAWHMTGVSEFEAWCKSSTAPITIVDDDVSTGSTVRHAQRHLRMLKCAVASVETLCTGGPMEGIEIFDVVDARDFVPGALHSGLLCMRRGGELVRVPYEHPEVNLCTRMKLSESDARAFTQQLRILKSIHFP